MVFDMAKLCLRQVRSCIGTRVGQRRTLKALGLGTVGRRASRPDTPEVRAMVRVVGHLVKIESDERGGVAS